MTKLEAIIKTRKRWERLKPGYRNVYTFEENQCSLCKFSYIIRNEEYDWINEGWRSKCKWCVWAHEFFDDRFNSSCQEWIQQFIGAVTTSEASLWRDTVVGMLLYLEDAYNE